MLKNIFPVYVILAVTALIGAISPQQALAFDYHFWRHTPGIDSIYDELNHLGLTVYGSLDRKSVTDHIHENLDSKIDPPGFHNFSFQSSPSSDTSKDLKGANIRFETVGGVITRVSVLDSDFLAISNLVAPIFPCPTVVV